MLKLIQACELIFLYLRPTSPLMYPENTFFLHDLYCCHLLPLQYLEIKKQLQLCNHVMNTSNSLTLKKKD